jgi:hypothetical protein
MEAVVPEPVDWSLVTFEGVRLQRQRDFLALSFREKVLRLEQMAEVQAWLRVQAAAGSRGSGRPQDR